MLLVTGLMQFFYPLHSFLHFLSAGPAQNIPMSQLSHIIQIHQDRHGADDHIPQIAECIRHLRKQKKAKNSRKDDLGVIINRNRPP